MGWIQIQLHGSQGKMGKFKVLIKVLNFNVVKISLFPFRIYIFKRSPSLSQGYKNIFLFHLNVLKFCFCINVLIHWDFFQMGVMSEFIFIFVHTANK
jgi:hypothetical protein